VSDTPIDYGVQRSMCPDVWALVAPADGTKLTLPEAQALYRAAGREMLDGSWRVVERTGDGPWHTKEEAEQLRRQPDTFRPAWSS
jgi:hypothetical protein